ncbi:AIF_collapsed_G0031860.mRNA.1.CDS.1 [Saccharomyces cerevisiae]|nr:AIF_collapsed_G0031860.mRNA.1.CDS.1 [Saccharomyces cerevisiae]
MGVTSELSSKYMNGCDKWRKTFGDNSDDSGPGRESLMKGNKVEDEKRDAKDKGIYDGPRRWRMNMT